MAIPPVSRTNFWQLLLAAELPSSKLGRVLEDVSPSSSDEDAVRRLESHRLLTDSERQRIAKASRTAVAGALASGARLVLAEEIPKRLAESAPHVAALFVRGDVATLDRPTVGIVGTRGATAYGKACAIKFAEAFARAGVTIVSGGAFGIDAAAHKGALDAGGKTAAVLPCGVDQSYPASHRNLYASIRESGCLISQFACGFLPRADTFLIRNGLIAALSDALLVVEAPEASGSLNTANRANEMGKPVYVVPGNISQLTFRGSHNLIRNGASLVDHPEQVLEEMRWMGAEVGPERKFAETPDQSRIMEQLGAEPVSPERIAAETGIDPAIVMSELTMLELEGRVIRSSGGITLAP